MIRRIGYAGICLGLPERSVSRTVRVANASPARLREIIRANLTDLLAILAYNVRQRFCLFRLNQAIVPLASHPVNTLRWWAEDECAPLLRRNGEFVRTHGLRVSMHPGQYTVLNSLNPSVVEASLAELGATCRVLDAMGLDRTHKIVIHGGVAKPDVPAGLARFAAGWRGLPENVRARLVLENDDKIFSAAELYPFCRELGIPLIFDTLHHAANPGPWAERPVAEILAEVAQSWGAADGIPKIHFSSQDPAKRPGAHAYWLNAADFLALMEHVAAVEVDVMCECKGKDLALMRLREELGWESLACC